MNKKLKKKTGSAFMLSLIALLVFYTLCFITIFELTKFKFTIVGEILDNSLTTSNFSVFGTKNLDLDLLSENPNLKIITIKNPNIALETFEEHLKYNLSLNDDFTPKYSSNFINSKVRIETFIIYNVNLVTNDVMEYKLNPSTMTFSKTDYPNARGNMKTENGNVIYVTTVDSKIGFSVVAFNKLQNVSFARDTGAYKK